MREEEEVESSFTVCNEQKQASEERISRFLSMLSTTFHSSSDNN